MCHDCRRGEPCARCLAEQHPEGRRCDRVLILPHSIAEFPATPEQELTVGAVVAAIAHGRRLLGVDA